MKPPDAALLVLPSELLKRVGERTSIFELTLNFKASKDALLLIPLGDALGHAASSPQLLASSRDWALISLENDDELEMVARDFIR
jgi:hypothetical protein